MKADGQLVRWGAESVELGVWWIPQCLVWSLLIVQDTQ